MIAAVVRKELRDQRPFAVLALVLVALDLVGDLLSSSPDLRPLGDNWKSLIGTDGLDLLMLVVTFSLGSGLLVRELDERTIELLDALPTRRWQLFGVKVAVALGALLILPVGELLVTLGFHAISRTSLDHDFHLPLLFGWLGLVTVQLFVALSVSLLLSFLRRLGWLILGVLSCLTMTLRDHHPLVRLFDPTQLLEPHFVGGHWQLPTRVLEAQVPVGLVCFALALALFSGAADRVFERSGKLLDRAWLRGTLAVCVAGTLVWASYLVFGKDADAHPKGGKDGSTYTFAPATLGHAQTLHYSFSFRADQLSRAEPLIARADDTYDRVASFLGVHDGPQILVDLTGAPRHLLGVTNATAIRMTLAGKDEEHISTLAHETTHALAHLLSAGAGDRSTLRDMQAFNEGLASYVEHRFFAPDRVEETRFWIAALRARDQLHFLRMIKDRTFLSETDPNMVYPVGEALVGAMVQRYGEDAPHRVLLAMARKDAPKELTGLKLWLDTFQAAGMDLPVLTDDVDREAISVLAQRRLEVDALPRPRAYLARGAHDRLEVRTVLDAKLPPGFELICRFRAEKDARFESLDYAEELHGAFPVPTVDVVAGRVWVQVGVMEPRTGRTLYERWVQLDVP